MKYLQLIRYPNLLMLAVMQLIIRYGFLELQNIPLGLSDWQYALLVLSTVLIAAAGYVINDILDQPTDAENKPSRVIVGTKISEEHAYYLYVALNIVGVGIGFYLANAIERPGFGSAFILIATLLYFYANTLKQMAVVGNVVVALILAMSVLIVVAFDILPMMYDYNRAQMLTVSSVLLDYAVFAFIVNLLREMVKDLEDVNGDYNQGMKTLPIVLGVGRTARVVFVLSLVPIALLLHYLHTYLFANDLYLSVIYGLVLVVAPLIYFSMRMWSASKKKEFAHLSLVLKFVIFFGIVSMAVISYNISHHA
ncbi:geranylgeranylglycerol-phosphate geranylgeranyltransferase [Flavobacterium caeni]|uniref:4-hydroxybenzoate polyprenyltransferase n=1 Tax=Flavobacterium caeni TaxID=490189 RepID=A0A1G5BNJ1_9FLAO|nr:geranylgeranylglycerol-phosphate geranylgeranyltransferase [Flavobacterium caeni]SCX91574.1 4-hydroxybenzoate polyprenyltransferase [Flavobacterium caeni]